VGDWGSLVGWISGKRRRNVSETGGGGERWEPFEARRDSWISRTMKDDARGVQSVQFSQYWKKEYTNPSRGVTWDNPNLRT